MNTSSAIMLEQISMTNDEFMMRLHSGKSLITNRIATKSVVVVTIYKYDESYVLHWEEFQEDHLHYRRASFRDEMVRLDDPVDVLQHIERLGFSAAEFREDA